MWLAVILVGLLLGLGAAAQPTEFSGCLGDGDFCSERPGELVDSSCGVDFYFFHGRISTPPLRALGPVTIAVNTRVVNTHYRYPVYVEIVWTPECAPADSVYTRTLVMVVHGLPACGGVWESIGPFELSPRYVPYGELYTIQLTLLEGDPPPFLRSVAVSCLRVTAESVGVADITWSRAKALYQ